MIGQLLRANSNHSGIFISKFYDSKNEPFIIKKSASTDSSISALKEELKGIIWYSNNSNHNLFYSYIDLEDYFSLNLSKNPFVLTIAQLFAYFNKILIIHQSSIKEKHQISSLIGVNPYFVREYLNASKRYSLPIVLRNIELVHDTDLKYKGIKPFASPKEKEAALLKELIFKLMH